jgi:type IV secretory pathway VirB2 component (pilin)
MAGFLERFHAAPLSNSFFFTALMGFIVTAIYFQFGGLDTDFAVTFMLLFGIMFTASVISMSKAPVEDLMKIHLKK